MKKRLIIFGIIVIIVAGILSYNRSYLRPIDLTIDWQENNKSSQEEMLYEFIDSKLTKKDYGVYTNYLDHNSEGEITKGHSVLSESEGLMLLYAVNAGDRKLFDEHFNIIKENMTLKNGLISWRIGTDEKSQVSSTIDELRIVKALMFAYDRWGDFKYKFYGTKYSRAILKYALDNERIIDFIDEYGKSKTQTLCYMDLPTVKILSLIDDRWNEVYNKANSLVVNGRVSDKVPLFKKSYSLETNTYDSEENIDLLLSLIVILNRVEAKEDESQSIKWIEEKLRYYGYLVSTYNKDTGEETSKIESPSIYAIAALIGKKSGNEFLFNKSIEKLKYYQIKNSNSTLYGSFGNETTQDVYSFDNLNALLAFQKINMK